MDSPKYERTFHFFWSPGGTSDDKRMKDTSCLLGVDLVITEKMDGSNVCMETGACFSRSHSGSPNHPSFDAFKQLHSTVKFRIPEYLQIFGEWCFALHSISYDKLPGYFLVFGVRDLRTMTWAAWEEVDMWATELDCPTVPILFRGTLDKEEQLKDTTEALASLPSVCGGLREGVVARVSREFSNVEFPTCVAKLVRKDHVQTTEHWTKQEIVRNKIA